MIIRNINYKIDRYDIINNSLIRIIKNSNFKLNLKTKENIWKKRLKVRLIFFKYAWVSDKWGSQSDKGDWQQLEHGCSTTLSSNFIYNMSKHDII